MDYSIEKPALVRKEAPDARNSNLLIIKGSLAIGWGLLALFCFAINPMFLVITFGLLNFAAGVLTLAYAYQNKQLRIAHQWLLLEGLVELAAGVVFTFFVADMNQFIQYMSYGIIFIITLQFIYGYTLLLMERFRVKNMAMRFLSVLVGTVISVSLLAGVFSPVASFIIIGLFSILYGSLNMQFARRLKNVVMGAAE
jgi:uncharacterized membrane protein HdeD (DUF308 family)